MSIATGWIRTRKGYDYYSDIHPKTEKQFRDQKALAGYFDWYNNWMVGRSLDERAQHTRDYYNIKWSDIDYPWLSGLTGGNEQSSYGKGVLQFSRNMEELYRDYKIITRPTDKYKGRGFPATRRDYDRWYH